MGPPPFGDGNSLLPRTRYQMRSMPSMGPPPFGDGNCAWEPSWWRWLSSFNGATAFRRWKLNGPVYGVDDFNDLQWGHRLSAMETRMAFGWITRFFDLQWGHRLSAMETIRPTPCGCSPLLLQWGHRLSAMETAKQPQRPSGSAQTFNGATAFRRWKPLFVARLRHGFMQKRSFPEESVTG